MKLLPVTAAALVAAMALPAGAADPGAARVYMQRTADGSVLLTDRPLEGVRTERTWTMEREDPVAARARSERVQREADAVSERIERRIAADEARMRELMSTHDGQQSPNEGTVVYGGYGYGYPGAGALARAAADKHSHGHHDQHDHVDHHDDHFSLHGPKQESRLGLRFGPPQKNVPRLFPF
jgi:hypothetical protein